jgi:hypothetical protein
MTFFKLSQRVSVKCDPSLKGRIVNILPVAKGKQFYEVLLDNGITTTYPENEIVQELLHSDPWELFSLNQFNSYMDFGIATTLFKVENTANNTISTLKASRTLFKAYQFKHENGKIKVFIHTKAGYCFQPKCLIVHRSNHPEKSSTHF